MVRDISTAICRSMLRWLTASRVVVRSTKILHQHQITGGLIDLRVENPAAVGRDGQRCFTRFDSCVLRKLPEERDFACSEIVKLESGAGRAIDVEEADSLAG